MEESERYTKRKNFSLHGLRGCGVGHRFLVSSVVPTRVSQPFLAVVVVIRLGTLKHALAVDAIVVSHVRLCTFAVFAIIELGMIVLTRFTPRSLTPEFLVVRKRASVFERVALGTPSFLALVHVLQIRRTVPLREKMYKPRIETAHASMLSKPFDVMVAYEQTTRGIGFENEIPWSAPSDLQAFRRRTMGHVLVMGRKTWDSLGRAPLPGRFHVIITHRPHAYWKDPAMENVAFVASFDHAIRYVDLVTKRIGSWYGKSAFVIGGQSVYEQALQHPCCRYVYATELQTMTGKSPPFDRQFPVLDRRRFLLVSASGWKRVRTFWIRFTCYHAW